MISDVSLFKNGHAFITRKVPILDGKGEIPFPVTASHSTISFSSDNGTVIANTQFSNPSQLSGDSAKFGHSGSIQSVWQRILKKNINRTVKVFLGPHGTNGTFQAPEVAVIEGEVLFCEEGCAVIRQIGSGAINIVGQDVCMLQSSDPEFDWKFATGVPSHLPQENITLISSALDTTEVTMTSLERGLTWIPCYHCDLSTDGLISVTLRATIWNDLEDLVNVKASLTTGCANFPFLNLPDPLIANLALPEMLRSLNQNQPIAGSLTPRSQQFGATSCQVQRSAFGGYSQLPQARDDFLLIGADGESEPEGDDEGSQQSGDLFFYDLTSFSLPKNARISTEIESLTSQVEHIYRWDATGSGNHVWTTIVFTNNTLVPLTSAIASIFSQGKIIGQSRLCFTPVGGKVSLKVNIALNIVATTTETLNDSQAHEETEKVQTHKLKIFNARATPVSNFCIKKEILGRYEEGSYDGKGSDVLPSYVIKESRIPHSLNNTVVLKWQNISIPAGKSVEFTFMSTKITAIKKKCNEHNAFGGFGVGAKNCSPFDKNY